MEETAEVLGISGDSAMRDWRLARLWLMRELMAEVGGGDHDVPRLHRHAGALHRNVLGHTGIAPDGGRRRDAARKGGQVHGKRGLLDRSRSPRNNYGRRSCSWMKVAHSCVQS